MKWPIYRDKFSFYIFYTSTLLFQHLPDFDIFFFIFNMFSMCKVEEIFHIDPLVLKSHHIQYVSFSFIIDFTVFSDLALHEGQYLS